MLCSLHVRDPAATCRFLVADTTLLTQAPANENDKFFRLNESIAQLVCASLFPLVLLRGERVHHAAALFCPRFIRGVWALSRAG